MDNHNEIAPPQYPVANRSAGPAPLRRPGSIRRTTTIDSDRSRGFGQPWTMTGQARDLLTPTGAAAPIVLASGGFDIATSPKREILAIAVDPHHDRIQELVGVRAGGASRQAMSAILSDIRGGPTFQLLDDFAGASLVSNWIFALWPERPDFPSRTEHSRSIAGRGGNMIDVCTGFAQGAASYRPDGSPDYSKQSRTAVGPLEHADDPLGWHPIPPQHGPASRRARFLDIWRVGGAIRVLAGFQDSGTSPDSGRVAIHEYRVHAELDEASGVLTGLEVEPLVLPYAECPGAARKASRMVGRHVRLFRDDVRETLPGPLGCTHLNDVLRSLADVPDLARLLPGSG